MRSPRRQSGGAERGFGAGVGGHSVLHRRPADVGCTRAFPPGGEFCGSNGGGGYRRVAPAQSRRGRRQADMECTGVFEIWTRSHIRGSIPSSAPQAASTRSGAAWLPLAAGHDCRRRHILVAGLLSRLPGDFRSGGLAFDYPAAEGGEFRRRLRTLAGLWQLFVRLPQLFTSGRPDAFFIFFPTIRTPRAALGDSADLGSTLALTDSRWRNFLLIDELTLVALAVLDRFVPRAFS